MDRPPVPGSPRPANEVGDGPDDDAGDAIRAALAGAQRISRTTPVRGRKRRRTSEDGTAGAKGTDVTPRRGGYSGPGPDANDPAPLGEVVAGYLADRGWERPLAEARVFTDWAVIVGADVAAHCEPSALRDGELRVAAESTAWATQLRLLAGTLLARIVAELGPGVVHRLVVTGPVGPSWKHGPRSVRGARGPRDTYG